MKEIRDIKIDLLMCNQNPILDMFRDITDGMGIINCDVYNKDGLEFIYYNKDGEWIFYQDVKNGQFWAHYKRYWEILEREFHLKYEEIQALTKFLVEEALKREVTTPGVLIMNEIGVVEEALKREVTTPLYKSNYCLDEVEEALKREVTTSPACPRNPMKLVEEVLKREVATPDLIDFETSILKQELKVEEALKREVTTPNSGGTWVSSKVEEALNREVATPVQHKVTLIDGVEEALKRAQTQTKI